MNAFVVSTRFARGRSRIARPLVLACALAVLAMLAAVCLPRAAYADGFSMPRVDIDATVQENGDLAVTEVRTFEFDDDVNGVFWTIPLAENQQGAVSEVSIQSAAVRESSSGGFNLQQVDYASNGDRGVYTVERTSEGGTDAVRLKLYLPYEDGDQATVAISYTMTGAVMNWADTAELYWQFVGPDWAEDSDNVRLNVRFAGAGMSGVAAVTGSDDANLRAWGHGPLDATVALDPAASADGAMVSYAVPEVEPDEFAEARVVFPSAWVPGLAASGEARLDSVLAEEQRWADQANARRERARKMRLVLTVCMAAGPAVFFALVLACKLGRPKPKPLFQDSYFRDVPSADHPAVIAAFTHRGSVGDEALVSTLMKLTDDRVISLEPLRRIEKGLFGREKTEEDYVLRVGESSQAGVADAIDRAALEMYFKGCSWESATTDAVARGAGRFGAPGAQGRFRSRTFDELQAYAKEHPKKYSRALDDYKAEVSAALEARNLVASNGYGAMGISVFVGTVLGVGLLFSIIFINVDSVFLPSFATFAIGLALTVAGIALGCTFRRLTPEGAELDARCRALKAWLEDFTRLKEAVPGDLILWNKLLVMAVALGVSSEVLRQLADAVPPEQREDAMGGYYYPVYWWCYPHHGMAAPVTVMHEAYSASMSELAGSSDSSGGGFGGGFSGGGGGGVGGGGGGTF